MRYTVRHHGRVLGTTLTLHREGKSEFPAHEIILQDRIPWESTGSEEDPYEGLDEQQRAELDAAVAHDLALISSWSLGDREESAEERAERDRRIEALWREVDESHYQVHLRLGNPGDLPSVRGGRPMSAGASTPCQPSRRVVWFTHMKTTVEISDTLFESARRLATRRGTTMRALIEEGLRAVLQAHRAAPARFALRDASVGGDGLADGVELGDWSQVRALIYDDTAP